MIDDDLKLCRLVTDYLSAMVYTVETAHNGAAGLERVQNGDYQAVILDVMMPEMDGFKVLKQIRQILNVPVLMLTALGDESDRMVGLEIGADDYLPKSFSINFSTRFTVSEATAYAKPAARIWVWQLLKPASKRAAQKFLPAIEHRTV